MARTFLFTQRRNDLDALVQRLDGLGFRFVAFEDSETAYVPARLTLTTPWMSIVEVVWQRRWWDDGSHQEDDVVMVKFDGGSLEVAYIGELLRQKLARPLAEIVTDQIVAALEELQKARGKA